MSGKLHYFNHKSEFSSISWKFILHKYPKPCHLALRYRLMLITLAIQEAEIRRIEV
jgi:hypothetical protein